MPRLVTMDTCAPAEPLKSAVWFTVPTLNSSMLSTGVGITPDGPPPPGAPETAVTVTWFTNPPLGSPAKPGV